MARDLDVKLLLCSFPFFHSDDIYVLRPVMTPLLSLGYVIDMRKYTIAVDT